ncbi:MAG: PDZ domain-containing protein [Helicobacteraceae bacterium]|nr:PDZ domain-containing protein [Helicobacteraceae bacterium]
MERGGIAMRAGTAFMLFALGLFGAVIEQIPSLVPAGFAPTIESASKGVVYLMTAEDDQAGIASPFSEDAWFRPYYQYPQLGLSSQKLRRSLGSGVALTKNGIIATSSRFVEGRSNVKVVVPSRPEPFDAKVLGSDLSAGIAVLRIIADDLEVLNFANMSSLETGDILFCIGNPFGLEPVVSLGIVSALGKQHEGDRFMQSDLFIHGGNIGGAIVNVRGELVGVPVRLRGMNNRENQGGFFVPIDRVLDIASRVEKSQGVKEAWLGIAVADLTQEMKGYFGREDGVVVTAVEAHSPAAAAGIKKGDLLLLADSMFIASVLDFERILATMSTERDVVFMYMRDKRLGEAVIRIGGLEGGSIGASRSIYHRGLVLENLTMIWKERLNLDSVGVGVVVADVENGTPAARSGFLAGDVIVQVDETDISSLASFQEYIGKKEPKTFLVMRGGLAIGLDITRTNAIFSGLD